MSLEKEAALREIWFLILIDIYKCLAFVFEAQHWKDVFRRLENASNRVKNGVFQCESMVDSWPGEVSAILNLRLEPVPQQSLLRRRRKGSFVPSECRKGLHFLCALSVFWGRHWQYSDRKPPPRGFSKNKILNLLSRNACICMYPQKEKTGTFYVEHRKK